jgi:hypothetical protein
MHHFTRCRVGAMLAACLVMHHAGAMAAGGRDQNHVDLSGEGSGVEAVFFIARACAAEAHLMPGACGAELLGLGGDKGFDHVVFSSGSDTSAAGTGDLAEDRGNPHIDFRIAIRPDGLVHVNGEELALCDPAEGCRISLAWSAAAGALVVQVRAADGALVAAQYHLAAAPSELRVEAAEIRWLSVTPQ